MKLLCNKVRHGGIDIEIREIAFPRVAYTFSALKCFTDDYPKKVSASFTASGKDRIICNVAFNTETGVM